jgi:glutamyl-tRNA(Gln) amidotransferase subunit D
VEVKTIRVPFKVASESMDSEHWKLLAEEVGALVNDPAIQGVIVTHGTDFLHYTAAALSFMLRDLGKPVVLTYSQRSIDRPSSDAHLNLQCAAFNDTNGAQSGGESRGYGRGAWCKTRVLCP